jgi:small multidrug resistance family-3 protein
LKVKHVRKKSAWGMALDGFKPDRFDYLGATICLVGVAVIMFASRGA